MIWHPPDPEPTPRCDDCGIEPEDELCAHGNCPSCARLLECCHLYCRGSVDLCDETQQLCRHGYCPDHLAACQDCRVERRADVTRTLEDYYIQRDEERRARGAAGAAVVGINQNRAR